MSHFGPADGDPATNAANGAAKRLTGTVIFIRQHRRRGFWYWAGFGLAFTASVAILLYVLFW